MGETVSAKICGFLRFPAKICGLFFGCFTVTRSAPSSAVFRLFSMSGIWHLCRWPQRLQTWFGVHEKCFKECFSRSTHLIFSSLVLFGTCKKNPPQKTTQRTPPYLKYYGMVTYSAVVFLLRPPYLLRCEPLFEGRTACKNQENCVSAGVVAIVNHCAITRSKFTTA